MLRRGIHDIYHASLLRIHHPNDDRWFSSRLYPELVAEMELEHENEWAADKIVSHAGSKNDAIFEVLWRAGDKTWLPYNQAQDLNLIQPYLEAIGVNSRADLPLGTSTPSTNDLQINLGSIRLLPYKACLKSHSHSFHRTATHHNHLLLAYSTSHPLLASSLNPTYNMSYRPKSHYKPHPLLVVRPDGLIQLNSVDLNLVIHPLQLAKYVKFDTAVRNRVATVNQYVPAGYPKFASAYNESKGINPCEFVTKKKAASSYNTDSLSIPPSLLTFPFVDQCYHNLQVFGLTTKEGDVDTNLWDICGRSGNA
ncbi:hypothetical protein C0993_006783 [Termitomyces sp. T159_Od127]|nr:hypothetical protein C0993_006783 [Termitomyces sp. T159_Od127]